MWHGIMNGSKSVILLINQSVSSTAGESVGQAVSQSASQILGWLDS